MFDTFGRGYSFCVGALGFGAGVIIHLLDNQIESFIFLFLLWQSIASPSPAAIKLNRQ
jgi:hypothetical protein